MKRSSNIASKMIYLLALFVAAVFIGADLPALAQNTNTGTTMQNDNMMMQGNMNGNMGRRTPRRRARRRARGNMNSNTGDATMTGNENMNMSGDTSMQNMNGNMSGDMQDNMNGNMNGNMNMGRRGRRGRRGTRRTTMDANMNANMSGDMNTNMSGNMNANMSGDVTGQNMNSNMSGGMMGGMQGGSTPGTGTPGEVADLSGTYTGTINYAEGGMTGDATLTISGNTFTLSGGAANATGTLSARSWPGYTALSMRFGDTLPATIVSARAWHRGRNLRIRSVRGEPRAFTFNGRMSQ